MTGYKESLSCLEQKESPHKVIIGDYSQYPIKIIGEASYKLDSRNPMKMKDVLYVPRLNKNILSISNLDKKGFRFYFVGGKFLVWTRGKTIDDAVEIGVEEGGLYKLKGHTYSTLATSTINPCELWHIRLAHVHYKALPIVRKVMTGLLELQIEHEGVCKGCAQGNNAKNPYPKSDSKAKGILDIIHIDICRPMKTISLRGCVYYASFIDEYSCKTWIYFLKKKDEVFERFKEFKSLVENLLRIK